MTRSAIDPRERTRAHRTNTAATRTAPTAARGVAAGSPQHETRPRSCAASSRWIQSQAVALPAVAALISGLAFCFTLPRAEELEVLAGRFHPASPEGLQVARACALLAALGLSIGLSLCGKTLAGSGQTLIAALCAACAALCAPNFGLSLGMRPEALLALPLAFAIRLRPRALRWAGSLLAIAAHGPMALVGFLLAAPRRSAPRESLRAEQAQRSTPIDSRILAGLLVLAMARSLLPDGLPQDPASPAASPAALAALAILLALALSRRVATRWPALTAALGLGLIAALGHIDLVGRAAATLALLAAIPAALALALHNTRRRPALRGLALFATGIALLSQAHAHRVAILGRPLDIATVLHARAASLPPVNARDFVAGLEPHGRALDPILLPHLWPHTDVHTATTLANVAVGEEVRIFRFGAELPPPLAAPETYRLESMFWGQVANPAELRLEAPVEGASLKALSADDEPEFIFSLPLEQDPGPSAFRFLAVGPARGVPAGGLRARRLDESVLRREEASGRVVYRWQPSLRSTQHGMAEQELRFEDGDIALHGHEIVWTIAVSPRGEGGRFQIARPQRLAVQPLPQP